MTHMELVETGRVRLEPEELTALADLYRLRGAARSSLLALGREASQPSDADALDWITSHTFRKTTATILDDAGQSARQIADQLGHARPSLTQDVYMGRRSKNPAAEAALDAALADPTETPKSYLLSGQSRGEQAAPDS